MAGFRFRDATVHTYCMVIRAAFEYYENYIQYSNVQRRGFSIFQRVQTSETGFVLQIIFRVREYPILIRSTFDKVDVDFLIIQIHNYTNV